MGDHHIAEFSAMASPCYVLIDSDSFDSAQLIADICYQETYRIEQKYSRYKGNNIIHKINNNDGHAIPIDNETFQLIQYADTCYQLSNGLFDISSGALRYLWKFDGKTQPPSNQKIQKYLKKIGWNKVKWNEGLIQLPPGMEIDLGGIGKEYAVDRCASLVAKKTLTSFAINYGGDIFVNNIRNNGQCWTIGIEKPDINTKSAIQNIQLKNGGIATSGNTKRFILFKNKRYGHILNPKTGKPINGAPLSVTVIAENCTQAGILATLAMLQGEEAESFLEKQQVRFWVYR